MTKFIIVQGKTNTGKSTSIRLFLNNQGVHLPAAPKDFLIVLPLTRAGKTYILGVASAGDTLEIIKHNMNFFGLYGCDFIVCATKSSGATVKWLSAYVSGLGATSKIITTAKTARTGWGAANAHIASLIDAEIP